MTGETAPTTTGDFKKTPFSNILVYLFEKRISGTLDVRYRDTRVIIYFREGTPVKVQTDVPKRGLGHVLLALGQITQAQLLEVNTRVQNTGGLQGQALLDLRMLDVNGLVQSLKKQIVLKMTDVFAMTDGEYEFYNKINKLSGFGPDEIFPVHPYTVLMSGLRTYSDKLDLRPVLTPLSDKWISLSTEMDKLRSFRLSTQEKLFVQHLLGAPSRYPDVLSEGAWKPEIGRYLLYGLRITKLLTVSDTAPISVHANQTDLSLASIPPLIVNSDDPEIAAAKNLVLTKAQEIASQNYYEMLGIDPDASTEDVRKAYFILSKKFHPDKVQKDIRISLKEAVNYVFSNLTEAHSVLIDPKRRDGYDAVLRHEEKNDAGQSMGEHREVRDALEAENQFQKAIIFLNKGEIKKATELVQAALILSPEEGEYLALAAHLQVLERPLLSPVPDLEKKLRHAAAQCPNSEKVNLYLADVLKRQGKWNEAKGYYRRILEINPRNINAAREIRLIEMHDKKTGKDSGGFLKRLFK